MLLSVFIHAGSCGLHAIIAKAFFIALVEHCRVLISISFVDGLSLSIVVTALDIVGGGSVLSGLGAFVFTWTAFVTGGDTALFTLVYLIAWCTNMMVLADESGLLQLVLQHFKLLIHFLHLQIDCFPFLIARIVVNFEFFNQGTVHLASWFCSGPAAALPWRRSATRLSREGTRFGVGSRVAISEILINRLVRVGNHRIVLTFHHFLLLENPHGQLILLLFQEVDVCDQSYVFSLDSLWLFLMVGGHRAQSVTETSDWGL